MDKIEIKVVSMSGHALPEYATELSAGMDVRAWLPDGAVVLQPGERRLIPTGLYMQLPPGYECQVRPRSGLALKYGITVLNAPGTIDADYRGEVGVILINLSDKTYEIADGERIAQLVIASCLQATWKPVASLEQTDRGQGGFGHTGNK